jgi:hypothetical protein
MKEVMIANVQRDGATGSFRDVEIDFDATIVDKVRGSLGAHRASLHLIGKRRPVAQGGLPCPQGFRSGLFPFRRYSRLRSASDISLPFIARD